jgi:hypothetical protein
MNRRDFLLCRPNASTHAVEISCERLYMRYLDLQSASDPAPPNIEPYDWALGEPAAVLERRTVEQFFADLEDQLRSADLVTFANEEWLGPDPLRASVDALAARLRAHGVRVDRSSIDGQRADAPTR